MGCESLGGMYKIFSGAKGRLVFMTYFAEAAQQILMQTSAAWGRLETWTYGGQRLVWDNPSAVKSPADCPAMTYLLAEVWSSVPTQGPSWLSLCRWTREAWVLCGSLQIMQNSWKWAEITGVPSVPNPDCRADG